MVPAPVNVNVTFWLVELPTGSLAKLTGAGLPAVAATELTVNVTLAVAVPGYDPWLEGVNVTQRVLAPAGSTVPLVTTVPEVEVSV
jgi:hypothetical protein